MALTEEQQFKARVVAQEHITLFLIAAIDQLQPNGNLVPALEDLLSRSVPKMQLEGCDEAFSNEFKAAVLQSGSDMLKSVTHMTSRK